MQRTSAQALVFAAILLAIAACSSSGSKRQNAVVFPDLSLEQCRAKLATFGLVAQPRPIGGSGSCAVTTGIELKSTNRAAFRPGLQTSCGMAVAWLAFESVVNQVLLNELGTRLKAVRHFGSYSCRRMSGNSRRMSLHSSARAFDISGFDLEDGRRISFQDNWNRGRAGKALKTIARRACDHFSVVLSPAHDRAHRDHLHVDIGPWSFCGA